MKIFCIGRNYVDHVKELQNSVPEEPVIFIKPETALLIRNRPFYLPDFSKEIHHEIEIVIKICRNGKNIARRFAHRYYNEIALGIDFTARDIQQELKKKGLPWEKAKAFDSSAPISHFIHKKEIPDLNKINFSLKKNGNPAQKGNTVNMIFPIDVLIVQISKYFTLKLGDLIFTGTPAGVGLVKPGDHLLGKIEDTVLLDFEVL